MEKNKYSNQKQMGLAMQKVWELVQDGKIHPGTLIFINELSKQVAIAFAEIVDTRCFTQPNDDGLWIKAQATDAGGEKDGPYTTDELFEKIFPAEK